MTNLSSLLLVFVSDWLIRFLVLIPLLLLIRRETVAAFHTGSALLLSWVIGSFFKDFFYVPRPFISLQLPPLSRIFLDGSFPSNHTAATIALATALMFHHRKFGLLVFGLGLLIGLSRVLTHVHFPLDIFGGVCLGIFNGIITSKINFSHLVLRPLKHQNRH